MEGVVHLVLRICMSFALFTNTQNIDDMLTYRVDDSRISLIQFDMDLKSARSISVLVEKGAHYEYLPRKSTFEVKPSPVSTLKNVPNYSSTGLRQVNLQSKLSEESVASICRLTSAFRICYIYQGSLLPCDRPSVTSLALPEGVGGP